MFKSRVKNSCGGIVFGVIFFFGSIALLWYNEGRSVKRYRALNDVESAVIKIDPNKIYLANEGQPVYFSSTLRSPTNIIDPIFGAGSSNDLKLRRDVEIYQWVENVKKTSRKTASGTRVTTKSYTYRKEWRSDLVDSETFKRRDGHHNPSSVPYESETFTANPINAGAYNLTEDLIDRLTWFKDLDGVSTESITDVTVRSATKQFGDKLYIGRSADPNNPNVGDITIAFQVVPSGTVSLIAEQVGNTLTTYSTKKGSEILLLQPGTVSLEMLLNDARSENKMWAWILRFAGFVIMFMSLNALVGPLKIFVDIIPILGDIIECGLSLVSFVVAFTVSSIVIAIAWIAYRPMLALFGIVLPVAFISLSVLYLQRRKTAKTDENTKLFHAVIV
uniref:Uncharacterized protein n=1 Tax=Proboscia inermis TaxID=420281 RepID=A0A7S0CM80_9STRA|mmetsp:Transcript_9524/g.9650  ORF Transcript_9524/g.9650 Transcript_9524/m.9650 type:complete len:390 (+) Transcript_9524:267-1436(+)|eukprot:CAMPEP_0171323574 /NCGR_PEP_ID=MMETSP0816-20121228/115659_1 /TAXON_ID=420281 /ORGANISM="Proboscia inermis, Strain CCAP1064/1" /LENGTH=389 /DNA_ID=CAMNT_0011822313 /DNA_START=200 /DNA_END=1369 /DNA_ORIENTATION=-